MNGIMNGIMNDIIIRPLISRDTSEVEGLDDKSGFYLGQWVADISEDDVSDSAYAWGVFKDNTLIGYCSTGYADDCRGSIENHEEHDSDSILLSDVYILQEYRHQGVGLKFLKEVLERLGNENAVFLVAQRDSLEKFYRKLDFEKIMEEDGSWNGAMMRHKINK